MVSIESSSDTELQRKKTGRSTLMQKLEFAMSSEDEDFSDQLSDDSRAGNHRTKESML